MTIFDELWELGMKIFEYERNHPMCERCDELEEEIERLEGEIGYLEDELSDRNIEIDEFKTKLIEAEKSVSGFLNELWKIF